ncbi:MAG: hypothetical protein IJQ02_09835 [Oscillospiraceae bacterium]|nr:hypothetical protein [Oscillospiraceae bacterium]
MNFFVPFLPMNSLPLPEKSGACYFRSFCSKRRNADLVQNVFSAAESVSRFLETVILSTAFAACRQFWPGFVQNTLNFGSFTD